MNFKLKKKILSFQQNNGFSLFSRFFSLYMDLCKQTLMDDLHRYVLYLRTNSLIFIFLQHNVDFLLHSYSIFLLFLFFCVQKLEKQNKRTFCNIHFIQRIELKFIEIDDDDESSSSKCVFSCNFK